MGILSYTTSVSIDGYIADAGRRLPVGPRMRTCSLHLARMAEVSTEVMGRKTYELMRFCPGEPTRRRGGDPRTRVREALEGHRQSVVSSTLTPAELGRNRSG